jgi:hypothetical protein
MPVTISDDDRATWKKRIGAAENDQRNYHALWYEVLAFCQGYHWVRYSSPQSRQLVTTPPPKYGRRYTVDELTQYRLTLLGELASDDDRPQAHFRAEGRPVEDYAAQANLALAYGWDEEWLGNRTLQEAKRTMIDLGTAPVRCRFDPGQGPPTGEKPFLGTEMLTREQAFQAIDQGQPVRLRNIPEGRIVWDAGLPFNALVPPGIPREWDFPWLVWKSVSYLPDLKARYPQVAKDLVADAVRSIATLSRPADQGPRGYTAENLGEHAFVYTCYQLPTDKDPQGRMLLFGCERLVPLEGFETLPYRAPDGTWRAGVYFLHAIRLNDRFWSRGFMENALDPQRAINEHATRIEQTIAHGQPFRWVEEGSIKKLPEGSAGSIGWLKPGKPRPQTDPGMPPGTWMYDAIRARREDLARAVLPEAALGENPVNVTTYSQLALLHSQARKRLASIIRQNQETVVHLMEDSIWDIRTKWGPEKQLLLAGTDGMLQAYTFNASIWPDYYKIGFAAGTPPRSQEAQLKLIEDMWNAALQSGAAVRDPDAWLAWRKQSLEAGKVLELPTAPVDEQIAKAEYENEMIMRQPDPNYARSLVDYFDNHALHLPRHRTTQSAARIMGRNDVFVAMEIHCKEHERQTMLTAMQQVGTPGPTMPHGEAIGAPSQMEGLPAPQVNVAVPPQNGGGGGQQAQQSQQQQS